MSIEGQPVGRILNPDIADQVTVVGLYYLPTPGAFSNHMVNVSQQWQNTLITWNANEWELK